MNEDRIIPDSTRSNPYGPLSPVRMFERTGTLLRENFKLFFGIVLIVIGVQIVVAGVLGGSGVWMRHTGIDASPVMAAFIVAPLSLLGAALVYIFTQVIQGALFLATQAKLANRSITVGEACRLAADQVGRLVGISILVALRILGYLLLLGFVCVVLLLFVGIGFGFFSHAISHNPFQFGHGASVARWLGGALVFLAIFVVYVCVTFWLVIRYAVAIPAALAEDISITEAIRRSIDLSKGSKGRLLALFLVVAGAWFLVAGVTIPLQLLATTHRAAYPDAALGVALVWAVMGIRILFSWVLITFAGVATALCYYDLRVRKEGFGMTTSAPTLGNPPALPPAAPAWPVEDTFTS